MRYLHFHWRFKTQIRRNWLPIKARMLRQRHEAPLLPLPDHWAARLHMVRVDREIGGTLYRSMDLQRVFERCWQNTEEQCAANTIAPEDFPFVFHGLLDEALASPQVHARPLVRLLDRMDENSALWQTVATTAGAPQWPDVLRGIKPRQWAQSPAKGLKLRR